MGECIAMRRREFIMLLGGAAAALPLGVGAQQPASPVIGYLSSASINFAIPIAFNKGLNEAGYFEGQNVTVERRWADGHYDRLPALAGELVDRHVNLIVASGGLVSAKAAKERTATAVATPMARNALGEVSLMKRCLLSGRDQYDRGGVARSPRIALNIRLLRPWNQGIYAFLRHLEG